jgi:hypothetical protein
MSISVSKSVVAVVALAAASALAAAASAAPGPHSFDVVLPKTNSAYVDTGRKGYTPGDYFLATGPVLAKVGGPRIGGLAGVWTLVSPAADKASVAIHLSRGTLYVDGRITHAAKQSVLRVRGGTDAFRGARGTASFRYLTETSALIHFELAR